MAKTSAAPDLAKLEREQYRLHYCLATEGLDSTEHVDTGWKFPKKGDGHVVDEGWDRSGATPKETAAVDTGDFSGKTLFSKKGDRKRN